MIPKGCRIPSKIPVRRKKKSFVFRSGRKDIPNYIDTKIAFLESCIAAEPDILKEYGLEDQ